MAETKKEPAAKKVRVRATQLGWYGNRRRREGAEFDVTLAYIPERVHAKDNKETGDKKGEVVDGTGCHQKMPSWVEPVSGKRAPEPTVETSIENDDADGEEGEQKNKSDESPL